MMLAAPLSLMVTSEHWQDQITQFKAEFHTNFQLWAGFERQVH